MTHGKGVIPDLSPDLSAAHKQLALVAVIGAVISVASGVLAHSASASIGCAALAAVVGLGIEVRAAILALRFQQTNFGQYVADSLALRQALDNTSSQKVRTIISVYESIIETNPDQSYCTKADESLSKCLTELRALDAGVLRVPIEHGFRYLRERLEDPGFESLRAVSRGTIWSGAEGRSYNEANVAAAGRVRIIRVFIEPDLERVPADTLNAMRQQDEAHIVVCVAKESEVPPYLLSGFAIFDGDAGRVYLSLDKQDDRTFTFEASRETTTVQQACDAFKHLLAISTPLSKVERLGADTGTVQAGQTQG
jgi:hypothetical protein